MRRIRFLAFAGVMTLVFCVRGQTVISPYSSNGLGELIYPGMPNHLGMGEVGIATPTFWHINNVNPALLVHNTLTTFQVGFQADLRNFRAANTTGSAGTGGLRYLNLSFPIISGKWTTAVSLLPYSTVNYDFFQSQDIVGSGTSAVNSFQGEGGLTRADWSHGLRLTSDFAVGVKASYFFGSVRNTLESFVTGDDAPFSIQYNDLVSYSDFAFEFGAFYKKSLGVGKIFNVGATFVPSTILAGNRDLAFTREASGAPVQVQVIGVDQDGDFELANTMGLGFSYQVLNKLLVGLDVNYSTGGEFSNNDNLFRESLKVATGVEWTPDYASVQSYWKRVSYRTGLTLQQLPYIVNGTEINDFGVSFGTSFPVNGVSTIDSAFKFGWRGTTENDLIRENYVQIVLGVTINDRWFIKRKFE